MSTAVDEPIKYSKKNPFIAKMKRSEILTKSGSEKDTRHYEIDLAGSRMEFLPGDSLAVQPQNDPAWVDLLLGALGFSGDEPVPGPDKAPKPIREALVTDYAITAPSKKFLKAVAEKSGADSELSDLLAPERKSELEDYLWGRETVDIIESSPGLHFEPAEFVGLLSKLNVRLYSIASALSAVPDEVHLTVAMVTYESHGRKRGGVCSTWLAHRLAEDTEIPVFITPGKGFRLPTPDDATPIIMCGPGTGIAPFRAFLQERKATNAQGDAWLIFGEQHAASDFFYEDEFKGYLQDGTLKRFDTAFSRDQEHKIYVQHRILEHGAEIWKWLENGAIFYVCGDAARMAVDVDEAIHHLVQEHGGKSEDEAAAYVEQMKADKRYRRDVY
ncbi:hypothetical protein BH23VER1_BH23VER1_05260 [soil metagenome]